MAKDTVTGTFGSDNIELNNAATEATLKLLLTEFKKVSGSDTQAKSKLKELGENAKKSGKKVDDLGESAKETSSRLGSGFRNVGQAAFGLTRSFIDGSDTLGEFSSNITGLIKTIPVFGAVFGETIQAFVNVVDSQIEVFRGLSSVGVTFGDSLFDTLQASTRANLALSTFTNVIGSNSTSLALLTGSANRGARQFTEISSIVQRSSRNFAALGLTVEETAEYQADFLDIQTRLGLAQQQNSTILGRQTVDYVNNLDELSRLTGRQRDEISKSLREETLDRRIGALLGTLDEDAQRRLRLVTQTLEGASPEVAEAFREMVATGGVPLSEFAQDLFRTNPRLGEMARGLRDGTVSVEEVMAEFRRTADVANNLTNSQLRLFSTTAALGSQVGSAALMMRGFTNIGEGLNESQLERLETEEKGANALLGFQAALLGVRNEIIGKLIDSGVFGKLEGILSRVVGVFTNQDAIDSIGRGIERFANWMTNLMDAIESDGLMETITKELGKAVSIIGEAIKDWFFSSPAVMATAVGFLFGPAVVSAAVAGIGKLFVSKAVVSALASGLGGGPRAAPRISRGVGAGAIVATGAQFIPSQEQGDLGDIARSTLTMAGTGAMIGAIGGPIGAAIGAGIGGTLGLGMGVYRRHTRDAQEASYSLENASDMNNLASFSTDIENANLSIDKMVSSLEELNVLLREKNEIIGNQDAITSGIPSSLTTSQNNGNNSLEEVNRTLVEILRVLTQTEDLDRRQLNALRASNNNLYAG